MLGAHGILGWIVIGGLAGLIAKALMPGRDPGGWSVLDSNELGSPPDPPGARELVHGAADDEMVR